MGVIKMNKNIKLATVMVSLGLVLFAYQNCSQIQPGLLVTDNKAGALSVDGDTQAIILDQDNNIVDVVPSQDSVATPDATPPADEQAGGQVQQADPVVTTVEHTEKDDDEDKDDDKDREDKDAKHDDDDKDNDSNIAESEESQEEIQASSCVELARKHKDAIDVSQLAEGTKIALVKGKTFIYSSSGPKTISSLSIGKSCGRTILCDVTIERIGEVNGRLDLYKDSSVREYGEQPKNIKTGG